jgi:hypothetical protein
VHEIPAFPKEFIDKWNENKAVFIAGLEETPYFIS